MDTDYSKSLSVCRCWFIHAYIVNGMTLKCVYIIQVKWTWFQAVREGDLKENIWQTIKTSAPSDEILEIGKSPQFLKSTTFTSDVSRQVIWSGGFQKTSKWATGYRKLTIWYEAARKTVVFQSFVVEYWALNDHTLKLNFNHSICSN